MSIRDLIAKPTHRLTLKVTVYCQDLETGKIVDKYIPDDTIVDLTWDDQLNFTYHFEIDQQGKILYKK